MKRKVYYHLALVTVSTVYLTACQPNFLSDDHPPKPTANARMSVEWLQDSRVAFGSSMEVETYTYRVVEDYGANSAKSLSQVNAAPRLYRERIDSRILEDGTMEMNTEQLRPMQLDKLPKGQQKWEELGPHRTEVRNSKATYFDSNQRQISQRDLKSNNYKSQIEEMRQVKGKPKNAPLARNEPTGYPKVDEATIRKAMLESTGGAKQLNKHIVQVRQDRPTPESKEYVLTTFDTFHGRVLASEVHDVATNKLLYRSACRYKNDKNGIKLVGIYSESYIEDALTGVKAKEIRYQTIENAQFVNNL